MKLANPPGAQFEILVDGKARSYRDIKAVAIASAEFLKSRNPHSEVAVKDLQSGEVTVVTRGSRARRWSCPSRTAPRCAFSFAGSRHSQDAVWCGRRWPNVVR
jgi:hypothetical protein